MRDQPRGSTGPARPHRPGPASPPPPPPGFDPDAAASGEGIYGLPHAPAEARVVLIPVPWDATVSYRAGAARGPETILAASRQVDLYDRDTGDPWRHGIALLPIPQEVAAWNAGARRLALPVLEAGGVARPDLDDWIAGVGGAPSLPEGESRPAPGPQSADDALVSGSWPAGTVEPLDEEGDLLRRAQAVDRLSAAMSGWVAARARELAAEGKLVGLVGGDHSTPLGLLREVASRHPGLGVLHLDAHADLRPAFEGFRYSHASIFWNVRRELPGVARLIQVGVRDYSGGEAALIAGSGGGIRPWFDGDLRRRLQDGEPWTSLAREIVADLPGEVYVSIDIDGLDPSLCPHTGTPVPGGLSFPEAVSLLRHVAESGRRIVGFDLVEVAPGPDGDEWDGNVGARLLYKLVGFALRSQEGTGAV